MVLIEQEESDDRNVTNPSNAGAENGNEASDGFETASDADLASDGEDGGTSSREGQDHPELHQQQKQTEEQQGAPLRSDSSEDASIIEEQLKQVPFQN
jgi:hypothetical protein